MVAFFFDGYHFLYDVDDCRRYIQLVSKNKRGRYVYFGSDPKAEMRDIVNSRNGGKETVTLRYSAPEGERNLKLVVGNESYDLKLSPTASENDWSTVSVKATMKKGSNEIKLLAAGGSGTLLLDSIVLKSE